MNLKGRAAAAGLMIPLILLISLYIPYSRSRLSPLPVISLQILDRNGMLLREVLSDQGGRCHWLSLKELSPDLIKSLLAAEDRNFFLHPGINPPAILRALLQNLKNRRVVSGASTITQQLARNLCNHPRTLAAKFHEAWIALRLEKQISKKEILIQYLNRVCFGNMTYGIDAASRLYFDKPPSHLSLAETAYLIGLPRSPARLNPYRHPHAARARQRVILDRMRRLGWIEQEAWLRARKEDLSIIPENRSFRAPHFCEFILDRVTGESRSRAGTVATTLDGSLQAKVEILTRNHLSRLKEKNIQQASAVVLDNRDSGILCLVGSRDFFDERNSGQVNGATALRQPGSTLKPFTYGLALERGLTAATLLEDRPIEFTTPGGRYQPRNFDRTFHGPVRMRRALACSYNVPAVALLSELGPDALYRRLRDAGFSSLERGAGFYGVGLTLGNGEVTLLELSAAYAALARGGEFFAASGRADGRDASGRVARRVFSSQTAHILTDMLSDPDARIPAFGYRSPLHLPFPCASKTGTSKDFRDNWTLGYTTRYTVGVWVGNFDGLPMHNVSGVTGCGPLFRDIMLLLHQSEPATRFSQPEGLVRARICPLSGQLASESCPGIMDELFVEGTEPSSFCRMRHDAQFPRPPAPGQMEGKSLSVTFPREGDIFKIDPVLRKKFQTLRLRADLPAGSRTEKLEWWINDRLLGCTSGESVFSWKLIPGSYTIVLVAHAGGRRIRSRPVSFRVIP